MKRVLSILIISLLGVTSASAAPKAVAVKKIEILTAAPEAEGFLISGKTLVTYRNTSGVNSNILLTGMDLTGVQIWQQVIDSGVDEVALASTIDLLGNIWLVGASAPVTAAETTTAPIAAENPDGVISEELPKFRSDMNVLTIWKISPTGELLATYSVALKVPADINGISVSSSGISIVGQLEEKPFLVSVSPMGVFGKIAYIGSAKTSLNSVLRNSDGTISIFGSSAETLAGKKLAGVRDGILIKISKSGAIASVVRSSAPKAERAWLAASQTYALTGLMKSGKVIESAFTQFTSTFVPKWTLRIPSTGQSTLVGAGTSTFGAITSTSAVTGVSGWKPTTPSVLILKFDSKGLITGAFGGNELLQPIALAYSEQAGIFGLAVASDQMISIFRLRAE